jgi:opacity protein-like surface antigen
MKKLLLAVAALGALSTSAMAASGPAGCGLGSVLFEGKQGLVFNVLAATFNGSSGSQTFGMSTGTLNCNVSDSTTVSKINFIEANKVALATEVAQGQGETLASLATVYGCNNLPVMSSALKVNYETIFGTTQSAEMINTKITNVLAENKACL